MSDPFVLVTGAAGKTGSVVVRELRSRDIRVRALVHRLDARSTQLADLGAEVRVTDMFDPYDVSAALAGVSRMYHVPPWHPHMLHSAVIVATEAGRAGVDTVVGLSQWLANPLHPSLATKQNWLVDRVFAMIPGIRHVRVEPGFFADNYLGYGLIGIAAQLGVYPTPTLDGRNAPPSTEDIARIAVAALLDPDRHAGKSYRPTGPRLLTVPELTGLIADALGRRVRPVRMSPRMFSRAQKVMGRATGMDAFQISTVRWYYEEHGLGSWEVGAPTDHVREVTGRPAEDFADVARRYAARPEAQRSTGNLTRAVWLMTRIGLTRAPRLDALDRRQQLPAPAATMLSGNSARWLDERLGPRVAAGPRPDAPADHPTHAASR